MTNIIIINESTVKINETTLSVFDFCKPLLSVTYDPNTDSFIENPDGFEEKEYDERSGISLQLWYEVKEAVISYLEGRAMPTLAFA